jgi:hypothetical protein
VVGVLWVIGILLSAVIFGLLAQDLEKGANGHYILTPRLLSRPPLMGGRQFVIDPVQRNL